MKFMIDRIPLWMGRGVEVRITSGHGPWQRGDRVNMFGRCEDAPCYVDRIDFHVAHVATGDAPIIPPAIVLQPDEAQQLCDALWDAGVRPTNGEGSTGQLAATQAHLADIKKVAFHALKIS